MSLGPFLLLQSLMYLRAKKPRKARKNSPPRVPPTMPPTSCLCVVSPGCSLELDTPVAVLSGGKSLVEVEGETGRTIGVTEMLDEGRKSGVDAAIEADLTWEESVT